MTFEQNPVNGSPDTSDLQPGDSGQEKPAEETTPAIDAAAATFAALAAPWVEPISAEAPCGADVRYEKGYEAIRNELAKQGLASAEEIDWNMIVREGETLLKERSKDLLVSAYVSWGWYRRDGLLGLTAGIALIAGLIEKYWEGLFPAVRRNARARANAVSWLAENTETLADKPLKPADRPTVELLDIGVKKLSDLIEERFDDESRPSVRALLRLVDRLKISLPAERAPAPKQTDKSAEPAKGPVESAGLSETGQSQGEPEKAALALPDVGQAAKNIVDEEQLNVFLADLRETLLEISSAIRAQNPSSAMAFRIARLATYLRTLEPPESDRPPKTIAPPPPTDAMQYLQRLLEEKKWPELLAESEELLGRFTFSLDCYRYGCLALEQLGPEYQRAYRVVLGELASLVIRIPELIGLQFSDGTPFASELTRQWIETQLGAGGAGKSTAATPESDSGSDSISAAVQEARRIAASGDVEGAMAVLQHAIVQVRGGRERFCLRFSLAQICATAKADKVAEAIYATLLSEVADQRLEEWEPELVTRFFVSYYEYLKQLSEDNDALAPKVETIYQRLCRLDPRWALGQSR
jgi:type VI secretion system protein VasJ